MYQDTRYIPNSLHVKAGKRQERKLYSSSHIPFTFKLRIHNPFAFQLERKLTWENRKISHK